MAVICQPHQHCIRRLETPENRRNTAITCGGCRTVFQIDIQNDFRLESATVDLE